VSAWWIDLRCIIRTQVRYLENLTNLGRGNLTSEQIKESIECLTDFLEIVKDNRASKGGSETWHFRLNLWHDRFDRVANIYRFATEGDLRKSPRDLPAIQIDYWLELIRSSLATQQYHRITTNPSIDEDRLKFSLAEVYVPLGLVKRQRTSIFIYAFDHSTFQEHFMARSIADRYYFFTSDIINNLVIFNLYWYKIIMFCFRRQDIAVSEKEALINFDN